MKKKEMDLDDPKTLNFVLGNDDKKTEYLEASPYNIEAFEDIGKGICLSILDLNEMNCSSPKNMRLLKLNLAVSLLKKAPFRFEPALRKLMRSLSVQAEMKKALKEIMSMLETNRNNTGNKPKVDQEKLPKRLSKNAGSLNNNIGTKPTHMKV